MVNLSKIIYLSQADFNTLVSGGTVTKEGVTYTYDSSVDYRVAFESDDVTELAFPTPTASDNGKVVAVNASGQYVLVQEAGIAVNPALAGTEEYVDAIQVDGTKYKVLHGIPGIQAGHSTVLTITAGTSTISGTATITATAEDYSKWDNHEALWAYLNAGGYISYATQYTEISGSLTVSGTTYDNVKGIYATTVSSINYINIYCNVSTSPSTEYTLAISAAPTECAVAYSDAVTLASTKSKVTASVTGSGANVAEYLTIDGTEYKLMDSAKVAISQGVSEAGKFLVVGSDGNVTTMTMQTWSGGSF